MGIQAACTDSLLQLEPEETIKNKNTANTSKEAIFEMQEMQEMLKRLQALCQEQKAVFPSTERDDSTSRREEHRPVILMHAKETMNLPYYFPHYLPLLI